MDDLGPHASRVCLGEGEGVRLGIPRLLARDAELSAKGNAVQAANARRRAYSVLPYIEGARRAGATTLQQLAGALTARGVRTPRRGENWRPGRSGAYSIANLAENGRDRRDARHQVGSRPWHETAVDIVVHRPTGDM